jgi:hypothetical protein
MFVIPAHRRVTQPSQAGFRDDYVPARPEIALIAVIRRGNHLQEIEKIPHGCGNDLKEGWRRWIILLSNASIHARGSQ